MRKLLLLGILSCLLGPGLAFAIPGNGNGNGNANGNGISAPDMGQAGLAGATLLGVAGYLALRRKRQSN